MNARPAEISSRVPDGALSFGALDAAYRIGALAKSLEERSELLTVALREHVSERDAKTKIKWTLNRVWLNPPEPAVAMIRWARDHVDSFPDRRAMHAGALLATYPFVGSVAELLGRSFALDEPITVVDLRRRVVALWGASSTVQEGVGKTVTTFRRLGLVNGGGRKPVLLSTRLPVTSLGATWLIHTTMLTRQVQAIDVDDANNAPELFWAELRKPDPDYPLLEVHSETTTRRVWAVR
jgi:hypothetical protein